MRDAYALLSVVAARTDRMRIASGVTNAQTRHLSVLAASWATLDELSNGRAVMGIGVGESSVRNLGLKPDRLADLEAKINALRALMRGDEATHDGETFHLTWPSRAVPIYMACSGPRSLQLGGRVADGVLFQVGSEPSFVQYVLDNIRIGAKAGGTRAGRHQALYASGVRRIGRPGQGAGTGQGLCRRGGVHHVLDRAEEIFSRPALG